VAVEAVETPEEPQVLAVEMVGQHLLQMVLVEP
jgi:hypothetical protein